MLKSILILSIVFVFYSRCTPDQINRYNARLSGPLLDRIDLHITVAALKESELMQQSDGESSAAIRARVSVARMQQIERQGKPNYQLDAQEIETHCVLDETGRTILRQAINKLNLSARAYHRILKVARTIADCDSKVKIQSQHIAEALQYRPKTSKG